MPLPRIVTPKPKPKPIYWYQYPYCIPSHQFDFRAFERDLQALSGDICDKSSVRAMSNSDESKEMPCNNGENMEDGNVRNPDSEPEEEDKEKGVEGEFGKVEVLDTEREKATDLDFQHCKIPKYFIAWVHRTHIIH